MLLSNAYAPDVRVRREAEGLVQAGYRISVICWDRDPAFPPRETDSGIDVIRVQDVLSSHGLGWRQVGYLPQFWKKARELAVSLEPDTIHCHDLDTLYCGWRLKQATGAALLFDAHEFYPASMSLYLPAPVVWLLARWERWLIKKADAVITASTVLRDEYLARGARRVTALGNYPDPARFQPVPSEDLHEARRALGVPADALLVSYIGGLHRNRMILPFIEAAARCPDVHFAVWGDGDQRDAIVEAATNYENVHYAGVTHPDEVSVCFQMSDVIYYGLRLDYPGAKYNAPNTLTQAMMTGRPVIATDVGDLGRIVETTRCGLLVDEATPDAIATAIDRLRTPERRMALGNNGREAALDRYNAQTMQKALVELYAEVMA